jgi:outer membrane protein assembly factor BamD
MGFTMQNFKIPTILLLIALLGSCSELKSTFDFTSSKPVEEELPAKNLAIKGMDDYNVGKYFTAIEFFEEILNRYPFSPEATLAELKAADCSYHLGRYQEALMLYEEFENHHPTNESIPYVMFQKAMCNYKRIDRIDRDTSGAISAIQLFKQLLKAYPDSPYTNEAQARIASAAEFLANHEYFVAQYYVRTEKYSEAVIRLKYMLAMYPDTGIGDQARDLLARIEAGDPPKSRLTSWFPNVISDWSFFREKDEENSAAGEFKR